MIWVKVFHIVFMVSWFAGLFYLPRLFVYHAQTDSEAVKEILKTMERRLYRGIMIPAMLLTWASGSWMASTYAFETYSGSKWLYLKIALGVFLVLYHHMCGRWLKNFAQNENRRSHQFFRVVNEIPLLFLISMVALVLLKPF